MGARRVCLVGAGKVAHMHAPALRATAGTELVAVCDPDAGRARALADAYSIPNVYGSLQDAVASGGFDFAHVLVPPEHHADVALPLIESGVGVLIEKPMGRSAAECAELAGASAAREVQVGVNHNSVFYPAYLELREALRTGSVGKLQHLVVVVNRPLDWLRAKSPWLHERPAHIAYESAVHPLAQIYDLAGPAKRVASLPTRRHEVQGGLHFFQTWQASFDCERATAQLCLTYGEYPAYQLVAICDDGVLSADVEAGRFTVVDRTRWARTRFGALLQPAHVTRQTVMAELAHGLRNLRGQLRREWVQRNIYVNSMKRSIAAFHQGPGPAEPRVNAEFGTQVVAMCDAMTDGTGAARSSARRNGRGRRLRKPDVVLLGGTGAIGRRVVAQMAQAGMAVRVIARNTVGLPPVYDRADVEVQAGDAADAASLSRALRGARAVVHLATSRERISWGTVESAVAKPAELLAERCACEGVERLICLGSIASLDLGDPAAIVSDRTPLDLGVSGVHPSDLATARLEQAILATAVVVGLPACVLRAGIVLGAGGQPFPPGLGIWRGETHCIGWNAGTNPLPLVLADDVAEAIRLAVASERVTQPAYNLVGDVRLPARDCVAGLREALGRPLSFHPGHPAQHFALSAGKYAAAAVLRRPSRPVPTYRAFKSKGCLARIDCAQFKREFGWRPLADRERFSERAFRGSDAT